MWQKEMHKLPLEESIKVLQAVFSCGYKVLDISFMAIVKFGDFSIMKVNNWVSNVTMIYYQ